MFKTAKPLIGTPREPQKSTQIFEFTPIGDENRHGTHHRNTTAKKGSADINSLINKAHRNPLNNSPLVNKLRGGSSFMDESEYDTIHNSASEQSKHNRPSSSPMTGAFHTNGHHDLLDNGSNPVRQQQEDISKLKSENYNLKVKIASLTKYLNAVTNQEQQYIYEENSRLQEHLIKLREEVTQLNRELSMKESQPQHPLSENNERYKDEIRKLRGIVEELEDSVKEKDEMRATMKELQEINHELQNELEHQSEKAKSSSPVSKSFVARLQEEVDHWKSTNEDNDFEIRRRDEELDEKDDMIEKLQAQIRELQQRSHHDTASESHVQELKLVIEDRDNHLMKQQMDLQALENEVRRLKDMLAKAHVEREDLVAAIQSLEKKLHSMEDVLMNRSTGEQSAAEIQRLQSANTVLESEVQKLLAKVKESKSIISEQKQVIDEFKETDSAVEDLKREKEHLNIKVDQLEREVERTYKAYQDAKKLHQQSRVKKADNEDLWKSEVDLLASKVRDLNVENEKLYNDLEKEKQTKSVDHDSYAKLEVKSLTAKCNDLQLELSERENALQRLSSQYQKELDRYESVVEQKERELSKVKNELRTLKMSTLQQLDDEKFELIKDKGSKESQIKLLQIELQNIKEQHQMEVESLRKIIERLKHSASNSAADLLDPDQSVDNNRELLHKITEKNNRIKYLNEKLTEALLTLKETQTRITHLENQRSDLSADNDRLEGKLVEMAEKLRDYKRDVQNIFSSRVERYDLEDAKIQLRLSEKENSEIKSSRRELVERLSALSEENGALQRRIEKIVDKYRQLQKSLNASDSGSSRALVTLQNKVEFFRMKHTKAIYHVKDLKFMNSFMKKSIQATNTHLQKDIKKLQDVGIYPDYDLICKKKPSLKVLMKFVLAAVRIKRKTEFSSVRNQKIELLEMKILD